MGNLATKNATPSQIFPLFRRAVETCETQCAIKVVAATCERASANLKFFRMHFGLAHDDELNVAYRTIIFFSEDKRYIYVISDPPHLLKTACNCLNNSGSGKDTHFKWNGGLILIWNRINDIFWKTRNVDYNSYPKLHMNMSILPHTL